MNYDKPYATFFFLPSQDGGNGGRQAEQLTVRLRECRFTTSLSAPGGLISNELLMTTDISMQLYPGNTNQEWGIFIQHMNEARIMAGTETFDMLIEHPGGLGWDCFREVIISGIDLGMGSGKEVRYMIQAYPNSVIRVYDITVDMVQALDSQGRPYLRPVSNS